MRALLSTQRRWMVTFVAVVLVTLLGGVAVLAATLSGEEVPAVANERPRPPLPQGSTDPGRDGAEQSAVAMASELQAVPLRSGGTCPDDRLDVSWSDPDGEFYRGSHVTPIGPAPDEGTRRVNGVVRCRRSAFSYAGFTARYDDGRWQINLVPSFDETEGDHPISPDVTPTDPAAPGDDDPAAGEDPDGGGDDGGDGGDDAPDTSTTTVPGLVDVPDIGAGAPALVPGESPVDATTFGPDSPWVGLWDEAIEPLAAYEPQQVCSPSPKPGTVGFHDLVLRTYPGSSDFGISRDCGRGGRSEHKEGRAWDWGVHVDRPAQKQAAAEVIGWLLATDEYGHQFAMARRLGVMYVIFNGHIWSAYDAAAGWRPYTGPNAHTDHVHISFDVDGGQGATSFWRIDILERFGLGQFGPAAILPEYDGPLAYGGAPDLTPADRRDLGDDDRDASEQRTPSSPVAPVPPTPAPGGGGTGGGGTGTGGGGTSPLPAVPSSPVPLPPLPTPTLPPVTLPPLPTVPGLPTCPPGTPLLPLPTHCLLPEADAQPATSGPSERSPLVLVPLALLGAAALWWYQRRTSQIS